MNKKTDIEMEQFRIAKTVRTLIRLKHSLNADEEINKTLPDTLADFEKSLQSGSLGGLVDLADLDMSDSQFILALDEILNGTSN